jgi:hypothetical protein
LAESRNVRRGLPLVVVALVLTAGCSGVFGGESPQETTGAVTPVPVSTDGGSPTATPTPTPPAARHPPGVTERGKVYATVLEAAHRDVLQDRSYTFVWRGTLPNDTGVPKAFNSTVQVVNDTRYYEESLTAENQWQQYGDDTGWYKRSFNETRNEWNVTYSRSDEVSRDALYATFATGFIPNDRNARDISVVERGDRTFFRLFFTEPPDRFGQPGTASVSNYSLTAYVTPEGLVRTTVITYDYTSNSTGRTHGANVRITYRDVGETFVEEPPWVERFKTMMVLGKVEPAPTPPAKTTNTPPPQETTPTATPGNVTSATTDNTTATPGQ